MVSAPRSPNIGRSGESKGLPDAFCPQERTMRTTALQILLAAALVTGGARLAAAQDAITDDALKAAHGPSGEYDHWRGDLKARQDATVMFYQMGRQQIQNLGLAGPAHVWVVPTPDLPKSVYHAKEPGDSAYCKTAPKDYHADDRFLFCHGSPESLQNPCPKYDPYRTFCIAARGGDTSKVEKMVWVELHTDWASKIRNSLGVHD